jgi:hypothetical protein
MAAAASLGQACGRRFGNNPDLWTYLTLWVGQGNAGMRLVVSLGDACIFSRMGTEKTSRDGPQRNPTTLTQGEVMTIVGFRSVLPGQFLMGGVRPDNEDARRQAWLVHENAAWQAGCGFGEKPLFARRVA